MHKIATKTEFITDAHSYGVDILPCLHLTSLISSSKLCNISKLISNRRCKMAILRLQQHLRLIKPRLYQHHENLG